jgi:hypothetical protein
MQDPRIKEISAALDRMGDWLAERDLIGEDNPALRSRRPSSSRSCCRRGESRLTARRTASGCTATATSRTRSWPPGCGRTVSTSTRCSTSTGCRPSGAWSTSRSSTRTDAHRPTSRLRVGGLRRVADRAAAGRVGSVSVRSAGVWRDELGVRCAKCERRPPSRYRARAGGINGARPKHRRKAR